MPNNPSTPKQDPWQQLRSKLPRSGPPRDTTHNRILDSDEQDYQTLRDGLPGFAREAVDSEAIEPATDADVFAEDARKGWCVVESPEGDFPRIRVFKSLEGLVRYFAKQEGKETSLWPFVGTPMRFTRRSNPKDGADEVRYLILPGETEAVAIPQSLREPLSFFSADLVLDGCELEDTGWVGPPDHLNSDSEGYLDYAEVGPGKSSHELDESGEQDDDEEPV